MEVSGFELLNAQGRSPLLGHKYVNVRHVHILWEHAVTCPQWVRVTIRLLYSRMHPADLPRAISCYTCHRDHLAFNAITSASGFAT